jgi:hypothetical protein
MIIKKTMEVSVNIDNARKALEVAGYYDAAQKSDEEVFQMAINMNHCYAVRYQERKE